MLKLFSKKTLVQLESELSRYNDAYAEAVRKDNFRLKNLYDVKIYNTQHRIDKLKRKK